LQQAYGRLLGKHLPERERFNVSLSELDQCLRHAQICDGLLQAVTLLKGPLLDPREGKRQEKQQWLNLLSSAQENTQNPVIITWLQELFQQGTLKRLAANLTEAELLLSHLMEMLAHLPAEGLLVKQLAAQVTGDAHGLDEDRPLTGLLLNIIAVLQGRDKASGASSRRKLWLSAGLVPDHVSGSVLLLGVDAREDSLCGQTLHQHAKAAQACRLTLAQLKAQRLTLVPHPLVAICENPAVVQAAMLSGATAVPIVCTDGQPVGAVTWLLAALANSGCVLAYHGDFDWPGIAIANRLRSLFDTIPWRMSPQDYQLTPAQLPLQGSPVPPAWSQQLGEEMISRGLAVHEEAMIPTLMKDLSNQGRGEAWPDFCA